MSKAARIGGPRLIPLGGSFIITIGLFFLLREAHKTEDELLFIIVCLLLSPFVPAVWMARKVLEINIDRNYIHDFVWIIGVKIGRKSKIKSASGFSLKEIPINTPDGRIVFDYAAYFHYNEGENRKLFQVEEKDAAVKQLKVLSTKTELPINTPL